MILSEELTPRNIETVLHHLGIECNGRTDSSGWKTIKSPLRDERNPSFGINIKTGAWKDHATGESGDLVTLAERVQNMDTKEAIRWIKQQTDVAAVLYGPPKNGTSTNSKPTAKKQEPFWTPERRRLWQKARQRLETETGHPLNTIAKNRECLGFETLQAFYCGIINGRKIGWSDSDWLVFPFDTGAKLYRLNSKTDKSLKYNWKEKSELKGSTSNPNATFFGKNKVTGDKRDLLIAKSPRETMLLWQEYSDRADVVGLATGEQGTLSRNQRSWLRSQISDSNYRRVAVILDCDNENARDKAESLATEVKKLAPGRNVCFVNIHKTSEGKFKDVTDCSRAGMSDELLWDILQNGKAIQKKESATANSLDMELDLSTAPPIPSQVYDSLPAMLQTRCSLLTESHRKDIFLVSTLPVIAAHLENVLAGHVDGHYSPDLYTLTVADPGTGKGVSSKAKKFATVLHRELIEQSKREKENYESLPDEEKVSLSPPKDRSLLIAANSSSRGIYDSLEANGGNGLIFETEIDTLLNATKQEWGDFSDVVRKAFHHESISINRKKERYWIEHPRLSICLTGTFDQFKNMFESAENGHFSRYALYTFDVPRTWQSHRPTKQSRQLVKSVETASQKLYEIYTRLNKRGKPLYIDLTPQQWQDIDDTFAEKMEIIEAFDLSKYLHASNNRAAVLALRMASIFAVLRTSEQAPGKLDSADSLTPSPADMTAALWLADTFIKHAMRLYYILPKSSSSNSRGERYNKFIAALPNEFKTADAYEIAEPLNIPKRTVRDWLSKDNQLKKIKHGHYEKR